MEYKTTGDYVLTGAIAGVLGGVVQTVYAIVIKSLHLANLEFVDYAELLIMGRDYPGTATVIGVIAHLINAAVWGVLFGVIIKTSRPAYYVTKGVGLGIFIWLLSLGLATIFKLKMFHMVPPKIAGTLLAGAILWGLTMSLVFKKLQKGNLDPLR